MMQSAKSLTVTSYIIGVSTAVLLTACATTKDREPPAPNLSFKVAEAECTPNLDFSNPIKRTDDQKKRNKQLRARQVQLKANMASRTTACLQSSGDKTGLPYAAFEIPTDLEGRVVNAGSEMATAVIFAGDVATYDSQGQIVRDFEPEEYRRIGDLLGVQFTPRENEKYVVIQANPNLIG